MDTTIDALKNLYVALGGDADDVEGVVLIPDMINAIATVAADVAEDAAKGAVAELPEVTATDNGSVLKVADGKWGVGTDEVSAAL